MIQHPKYRRVLRISVIVLLFIIALNALAAGFSFMVEPTGKDIGISTDYLRHSPFNDFFIPGIILFTANGVLGIITAILAIRKTTHYQLWIIAQGCILLGWIIIQMILVQDFNWMHFVCLVMGSVLVVAGGVLKRK
jgi:hypothetical protein